MRNCAETCKNICSYNLVYKFLIQLLPLKGLVFLVHFLNAFCHGNETFRKGSSQPEIIPLIVVFHLPYSKYNGVKMFLPVSLSKSKFFTHIALVSFVQHSCRIRALVSQLCCIRVASVALVSLVSGTRKLDQIHFCQLFQLLLVSPCNLSFRKKKYFLEMFS